MSRTICLALSLLLLTSFGHRKADYCKMAERLADRYAIEFAQPRGLMLCRYGGAMMDDIQEVSLGFTSFIALSVDQARIYYVEMMEEFLCRINSDEEIRPYLHNYPFEEENIKLRIGFDDSQGKILSDGQVAQMGIVKDHKLYFAAYDSEKEKFYDLHEESYEEALKIVQNQKKRAL